MGARIVAPVFILNLIILNILLSKDNFRQICLTALGHFPADLHRIKSTLAVEKRQRQTHTHTQGERERERERETDRE